MLGLIVRKEYNNMSKKYVKIIISFEYIEFKKRDYYYYYQFIKSYF